MLPAPSDADVKKGAGGSPERRSSITSAAAVAASQPGALKEKRPSDMGPGWKGSWPEKQILPAPSKTGELRSLCLSVGLRLQSVDHTC